MNTDEKFDCLKNNQKIWDIAQVAVFRKLRFIKTWDLESFLGLKPISTKTKFPLRLVRIYFNTHYMNFVVSPKTQLSVAHSRICAANDIDLDMAFIRSSSVLKNLPATSTYPPSSPSLAAAVADRISEVEADDIRLSTSVSNLSSDSDEGADDDIEKISRNIIIPEPHLIKNDNVTDIGWEELLRFAAISYILSDGKIPTFTI